MTGREHTATTDQYAYRMRDYDAATGRFLQTDPMGLRAGDTNSYRLVRNATTAATDPSGLETTAERMESGELATVDGYGTGPQ